jgi:hypothetical protein
MLQDFDVNLLHISDYTVHISFDLITSSDWEKINYLLKFIKIQKSLLIYYY